MVIIRNNRYARMKISTEISALKKDIDRLLTLKNSGVSRDYIASEIRKKRDDIRDLLSRQKRYYGI
jgi:orotate phosphoribosyltransferase-like protein